MSNIANSGGCGCGSGGGCDCGTTNICVDEAFKRPQFFAGQLLTEDDLQALTDYVVGKNRLHNRFLFGDGVVCGLSVTCHPCGGEKVTVAPGYALDCCGNDILLPCKEEIDVKSLVRDLRQRQLAGYDCGDPCDEKESGSRTYGLYLTYTETADELVAPYSSGDPCGQQKCEPSRICEGYKFELRCDCTNDKRADIFTRVAACVGDLKSAASAVAKAQVGQVMASEIDVGLQSALQEQPVPFTENSIETLRETEVQLATLRKSVDEAESPAFKMATSERELREKATEYQAMMGAMVRFKAQPEETREQLLKDNDDLSDILKNAELTLAEAGPKIVELSNDKIVDPTIRTRIEENVKLAENYAIGEKPAESYETIEAKMIAYNSPVSTSQLQRMSFDASLLKSWLLERLEGSASLTRCDLYDRAMAVTIPSATTDVSTVRTNSNAARELAQIMIEFFADCVCLALNPACNDCTDNSVLLACVEVENCEVIDICNMSRRFVLSPMAMRYWLPPLGWIGKLAEKLCCGIDFSQLFDRQDPEEGNQGEIALVQSPQSAAAIEKPSRRAISIAKSYVPRMEKLDLDGSAAMVLDKVKLPASQLKDLGDFSTNLAMLSVNSSKIDTGTISLAADASVKKVRALLTPAVSVAAADTPAMREDISLMMKEEVSAVRANMTDDIRAELVKEAEVAKKAMREEISRDLSASIAKELENSLKADLSKEMTSSIKTNVESRVKSAVGKELTASKLRSTVKNLPSIKTMAEENKKLRAEVKKLTTSVNSMKGDAG